MSQPEAQKNYNAAAGFIEAKSVSYFPTSRDTDRNSFQRSRSGSRDRGHHAVAEDDKELMEELQERAILQQKAMEANLCEEIREGLQRFVDTGMVKEGEFDLKACTSLVNLSLPLQRQVLHYMENEKVFLANARSKSGFLVSSCEKAKQGMLDARGFIGKDPWKDYLLQIGRPRITQIDLLPEKEWLDRHGQEPAKLLIDVGADSAFQAFGTNTVSLVVNLNQSCETVKNRLVVIGVQMPVSKMRLKSANGFLKDGRTLAFYNLQSGSELQLLPKTRAGKALKKDQSDGFDPAFCDGLTSLAPSI